MPRNYKITQTTDSDFWYNEFSKKLETTTSDPSSRKSLYDEILSVMNGKPKFSSVEDVVKEMQERSGLTSYLNGNNNSVRKKAQTDQSSELENKKQKVNNEVLAYIEKTKGLNSAAAIINKLENSQIIKEDNDLLRYISSEEFKNFVVENNNKLKSERIHKEDASISYENNTATTGDVDFNRDFFQGLMPQQK